MALTALLLFIGGVPGETTGQENQPEVPAGLESTDPAVALEQAGGTLRDLVLGFYAFLPKLVVALVLLGIAWLIATVVRSTLRKALGQWERTDAVNAVATIAIYLAATVIAMSILAGDARALLGSVGLIGLALSWALQTPIESFTGWFLNSLRGYYRVGDRIEVGEVFGDVYRIDVLTTTVWEAGGPGKAVAGAQPTGAMVTFPNWEVLRSNIVNYSRDFPYVWDEVTVAIANESDLEHAAQTFEAVAGRLVGDQMTRAATHYRDLLHRARIAFDIDERPRVFISGADAWTNCTVRYLVDARKRRRMASDLNIALAKVTSDPEHRGRIVPAYPRTEIRFRRTWQPVPPAERS
ncbi:MAG TPA: mechanosensitive ion channel domain-containing protein [Vicinamibacterales bacterium]|nr:mechanosensitive ion channel domain-containing protein [Vicinamibacterales bacterium]